MTISAPVPLIKPAMLIRAGVGTALAAVFAPLLEEVAVRRNIHTPARVACWLANMLNETGGLTALSENMRYTTVSRLMQAFHSRFPTAASAARFVNQPEELGDFVYAALGGYAFRAHGPGITGRVNFNAYAVACQRPAATIGDWMATPAGCADSGGWYWELMGCNAYADAGDLLSVRDCWAGLRPHTAGPFGIAEVTAWHGKVVAAMAGTTAAPPAGTSTHSVAAVQVAQADATDRLNDAQLASIKGA